MKCFSLKIMEQTHLISVCVFCLLCATHIHCSEYSSRAVKSKIKAKGGESIDRFERGPGWIGSSAVKRASRGVSNGPGYPSTQDLSGIRSEFLNSSQRIGESRNGESNPPGGVGGGSGGGGGGRVVGEELGDRSLALTDANEIETFRNGIQSVKKYIKIPESRSVGVTSWRRRKREGDGERSRVTDDQLYVENLFNKYRNSENRIDLNGFKEMMNHLGLSYFAIDGRENHREHINSLELRDGAHTENGHGNRTHRECLSPGNLLRTVVAESLPADGVNATRNVTHGEKRSEDEEEGTEKLVSVIGGDVYLSKTGLLKLCPFLLYQLVEPQTCLLPHEHEEEMDENHLHVWLYATASVVVVSLCGLLGVFVIPIMGHSFYQQLLQFLVALAVGTLCGDALLHLLPHAMIPHNDEAHVGEPHDHDHTSTMWKGLAVLLGIVFFFFTEKCLTLASEWRKKHQRNKKLQGHSHVQILNGSNESDSVGEKLCKHKYSSYPYCYPDIKSNKDGHEHSRRHGNDASKHSSGDERDTKLSLVPKWHYDAKDAGENQRLTHVPDHDQKEIAVDEDHGTVRDDKMEENEVSCGRKDGEYTVIIREHESIHHGHSHAHGHVHSPPESLSSVAWMVILGDGLHNFTDGMAIGAAFANNIAGGFSTAVAVFCHELPHELGDFAVLIKAGMSAKQAVFYNLISSILCFFGMCLGIFVGDNPQATSWVFAVSAGMFLYIGLVDMFPELTSSHSAIESSFCQCSLQGLGLIAGVTIMLIIAFYEDQLLTLFN